MCNRAVHETSWKKSSRQVENGRYALQILRDDIEHAGFFGTYTPASGVAITQPADPCAVTFGAANSGWDTSPPSVPVPLFGYSGASSSPLPTTRCPQLPFYKPNTAVLVSRRTATATVASAVAGATYLQAAECSNGPGPFAYGTSGFSLKLKDCVSLAPLNPYLVDIYYVSTCDVCGSDNIPTLKLVQAGPTAAPSEAPLVEGIEDMQFTYGIDNTGTGAPDTFSATPAASDWPNVMSVRVNLLARNLECTVGYTDSKTYTLGGPGPASAPAKTCNNGDYKRHVYSEVVRAINPSGWREKP